MLSNSIGCGQSATYLGSGVKLDRWPLLGHFDHLHLACFEYGRVHELATRCSSCRESTGRQDREKEVARTRHKATA